MSECIKSRKNDFVKQFIKLQKSAAYRKETGLFAIEGARLCEDAAKSAAHIIRLFYTEKAYEKYRAYIDVIIEKADEVYETEPFIAEAMSSVESNQGVFCVCEMKESLTQEELCRSQKYIAAENLQDPSNIGAVMRTAEALGIDGVILSGDSCDIYAPKVLRASMGAVFRFPVCIAENFPEMFKNLKKEGFRIFGAVADRSALPVTDADYKNGCIAVIGNEGNGLTKETKDACCELITIPMKGRAESLNASAAASVLIWEMMRG